MNKLEQVFVKVKEFKTGKGKSLTRDQELDFYRNLAHSLYENYPSRNPDFSGSPDEILDQELDNLSQQYS
jgi:hypothetical protein